MAWTDCEVCGSNRWRPIYSGPIRDGVFGKSRPESDIRECICCGVRRLNEDFCPNDSFYDTEEYRTRLQNGVDSASYFLEQDALQIHTLKLLSGVNLRGKVVADVGCGGGSLLDHLSGVAAKKIAIEPYDVYRKDLKQRGYSSFAYAAQAVQGHEGKVDLAFSMQVIEHVNNPRTFLEEIKPLLKKDGELWISTPNRDDILGDLLPDDYLSFFYRVVHRWYFDAESLAKCANEAGFDVKSVHYVHRYSMANLLRWLRDRKPTGNTHIEGLDETVDAFWKVYLEKTGKSDCLYMVLSPSVK